MFRCFCKFVFAEFLTTWVRVEIVFYSRMVISSLFWSYSLHFLIIIHGRQFEFTEAKVINLGVELYDCNTSCGNNNVWHNFCDHTCLRARVLKMEGADLLLALFIRLWFSVIFIMIFYLWFFYEFIQSEVNYSIIFVHS